MRHGVGSDALNAGEYYNLPTKRPEIDSDEPRVTSRNTLEKSACRLLASTLSLEGQRWTDEFSKNL